ncbi:MAG: EamA family transporter RarD [Rhizobium sp.]
MAIDTVKPESGTNGAIRGFGFAMTAYLFWGILPLYMKALAHIPAFEVIAHRIFWSVPVAGIVLLALGRMGDVKVALRNPRTVAMASLTATLVTINWGTYVWAIGAGHSLDAALGYFINPLFSIALGAILLKEKLAPTQIIAICLAAIAVIILTVEAGTLPWVALSLTFSWGFYAFFRKTLPVGANQGFFIEVLLLCIPATLYIIYLEARGEGHFYQAGLADTALLLGCGLVTALPLMIFANGAKLLKMSTLGIMQYIVPTMVFLIAVFLFKEPFDTTQLIAFSLIWAGLALYSWSMLNQSRGR